MGEHRAFTRPPIAAGETEAQWDWSDMCDICHPLLWSHSHSPVPPCTQFQPHCTLRLPELERGRSRASHQSSAGRVSMAGVAQHQCQGWPTWYLAVPQPCQQGGRWDVAGTGGQGRAAPGWDSARALHAPAPLPWGTRQPGLCPRPFVWHLLPAPAAAPQHGLEPLRGSGCDPDASGRNETGIPNGQQPPRLALGGSCS